MDSDLGRVTHIPEYFQPSPRCVAAQREQMHSALYSPLGLVFVEQHTKILTAALALSASHSLVSSTELLAFLCASLNIFEWRNL